MKNSTLRVRPIGVGNNVHSFYFVNEELWLETINSPKKRNSLKTVKVDFVHKKITPPELVKNVFPFDNQNEFSVSEKKFINMRIFLNFDLKDIQDYLCKPLKLKSLLNCY